MGGGVGPTCCTGRGFQSVTYIYDKYIKGGLPLTLGYDRCAYIFVYIRHRELNMDSSGPKMYSEILYDVFRVSELLFQVWSMKKVHIS